MLRPPLSTWPVITAPSAVVYTKRVFPTQVALQASTPQGDAHPYRAPFILIGNGL
jgi:hypothetical protein